MNKMFLKASAAAAVLFLATGGAYADPLAISQEPTNSATVTVGGTAATIDGVGALGQGASASISASGAPASVSVAGINVDFTSAPSDGFDLITQSSTNEGNITVNEGTINIAGATTGDGASAAISVSGTTSSIGFTGNGAIDFTMPSTGSINQTATNSGELVNGGGDSSSISATSLTLSGDASSLSVSTSGATAAVSTTGIGANSFGGSSFGEMQQWSVNTDGATLDNKGDIQAAGISGDGASIGVSARGASASVSATTIGTDSSAGNSYSDIGQSVYNGDETGAEITNSGSITLTDSVTGVGSSVSVSASGASASFSVASIADGAGTTAVTAPYISQTSVNSTGSSITNDGTITLANAGSDLGTAASASISATGAGTFVSFSTMAAPADAGAGAGAGAGGAGPGGV